MKRLFHGLVAFAVGLMMAVPLGAFAYTYDEGGFHWEYNVWYDEDDGAWEASVYKVRQIDEKGNWKEWDATALVVPATLPAVGTNEFARSESVYDESGNFLSNKYVTVYGPDVKSVVATVVYVDACQEDNDKLTSLTIPETVEEVYGFGRCTNLSTVVMGADTEFTHEAFAATPWLKEQGEFVVRGDVLVAYQGAATSVTVPDGIVEIGDGAFAVWYNEDMTNLTSVTLPVGLEEIDNEAFDGCEKLASINMPDSLVLIGDYAFSGCESLTTVTLPAKLKRLGAGAFSHCNGLNSIAIPEKVKELEYEAFYCCTGLTSVAFSNGLKFIGSEAFFGANLTTVDIPASVKSIGPEAFAYCKNLAAVTGCAGLEEVGWNPFYMTAVYDNITDGILQVGPIVIGYKGTLPEELTIPEGVTKINDEAFLNASVKTLNLPSTLKEIGWRAFKGSAVETVNGGSGVTKVANDPWDSDGAFDSTPYENTFKADRGNNGKQFALVCIGGVALGYVGVCPAEIVIPDSVTCLSVSLFDHDLDSSTTNIESIVVGSGVKAIQNYAFYDAMNLKTVTVFGALDEWGGDGVFSGCTSLTDVTLTGSNLQLEGTFDWCTNLVNVTINLVEPEESEDEDAEAFLSLDSWTFSGCDKLASVKVTRPGFQLIGWNTWGALYEEVTFADEIDTFRLWRVMRDGKGEIYDYDGLSFQPKWKRVLRSAENDSPFTTTVASTYIGWLTDADGNFVGSVSIKVQKGKAGATSSKATAKVTMIGSKKVTLKGEIDANGNCQGALAGLVLTANGLAGTLAVNGVAYAADGARDVSKTKNDSEQSVLDALKDKVWTLVLAPRGEPTSPFANGFAGLSVTMGSKGKAKLTGMMPDGTKLNVSSQTAVGEASCCIPIVFSKAKATIGFLLWVDRAGEALDVTAISQWKSTPSGSEAFAADMRLVDFDELKPIQASTTFTVDPDDLPATLTGVLTQYLPIDEPVNVAAPGGAWNFAKSAAIKYKKGVFDQDAYEKGVAKGKTNVPGLSLKYVPKTGRFSGKFKIFTLEGEKFKKVSVNVNGVVCDGVGYGSALIKKQGAMPVLIGDEDEE